MADDDKEIHGRLKKKEYQKKLLKLLADADSLDAKIIKNTKTMIRKMRDQVLSKTAEAQARSSSGVEPEWGHYWGQKLTAAYNKVVEDIGNQFHEDLSKYTIEAAENGHKLADESLEFAAPGIEIKAPKFHPEQLKISSSFSADLITRMKKYQTDAIGKEVALSMLPGNNNGIQGLISKLAVSIDKGP